MKWLDRVIGRVRERTVVHLMGGGMAGDFRTDAYKNAVVRASVDAIARQGAKLKGRHVRGKSPIAQPGRDWIEYALQTRPNPWMSAYDFLYKMITQAMLKNNGFALISWDNDRLYLLPIDYVSCEAMQDERTQELFIRFMLVDGRTLTAPYDDLIHLRRFYNGQKVMGDDNEPLKDAVELVNVSNAGMSSAIRAGTTIRGLLTAANKVLDEKELKKRRDEFVADYGSPENSSGIAALDGVLKYEALDASKMYKIDPEQQKEIRNNVYRYFGINEAIVSGDYSENQWNAFYEGTLEPIAVQLSLECTEKLFTERERGHGNAVMFEANRLQYASAATKINLLKNVAQFGVLTVNEARDILNLPPLEDGGKRMQSLNYINADKADQYQLGSDGENVEQDEEDTAERDEL